MRRVTAVSLAISAWLLGPNPAIAQSHSGIEQPRVSLTSVHQYVAGEAIPRQLAAPPNLLVSPIYRPLVESMLRDSPTFRRQCLRIASEPGLRVRLDIGTSRLRSDVLATTRMTRNDKGRFALVDIGRRHHIEELIAHEFEHIIEQLDGIDLAAHAARRGTGVSTVGYSLYETTRARRIGIKVVSELAR